MSMAKAFVTGIVYREPETGYSGNNIAVSSFVLNISDKEEVLIRVISKRQALLETVESLKKGEKVLVEGRLQTNSVPMDDGSEKRIYEIEAGTIEKMGATSNITTNTNYGTEEIVKFESDDLSNELIGEDEIPF